MGRLRALTALETKMLELPVLCRPIAQAHLEVQGNCNPINMGLRDPLIMWGYTVSTTTIAVYLSLTSKPSSSIAHSPNILLSHSRTCALRQHVPILAYRSGLRGAEYGKMCSTIFWMQKEGPFLADAHLWRSVGAKRQAREREPALVLSSGTQ